MTTIDGNQIARSIVEELKTRASETVEKKTAFILLSNSKEAESFINKKTEVAKDLGIKSDIVKKSAKNTEDALGILGEVVGKGYDGVVVQFPLGESIDANALLDAIPVALDIDMLSEEAKRNYIEGTTERVPPVAQAVHEILSRYMVDLFGDEIVVLGKGRLVGEPISLYLERLKMPYKIFDEFSDKDLMMEAISRADVIISGMGNPRYIKPNMVKDGVVLIDAGTSESGGKLVGDMDPLCAEKASLYSPVPGGVGPIAVASLFSNLFTN